LTIYGHETSNGVIEYFIAILQSERLWELKRRYRDFSNLHKKLVVETTVYGTYLPDLPRKRWFESKRWLNRYVSIPK
jgi:hypothetical protein